MIGRRGFLIGAALLATGCATDTPQRTVRIAAGEAGGFYVEFGRLLARELTGAGVPAQVVETTGTSDNITRVRDGRAELALVLADTMAAARHGIEPFGQPVDLGAIGRVYENYMQFVVRATNPARTLTDLAGARVSLGADGSGAAVFGDRLLRAAGVSLRVDHRPLAEAAAALRAGDVDALLWSGGVPTPALAAIPDIRLLDLGGYVEPLRAAHGPVYEQVAVPTGSYGASADVPTVGVPNLLVARPDLPGDIVADAVRVLVGRAADLVPPQAVGTQYLDVRSLIDTTPIPLHPAAAEAYRTLHG